MMSNPGHPGHPQQSGLGGHPSQGQRAHTQAKVHTTIPITRATQKQRRQRPGGGDNPHQQGQQGGQQGGANNNMAASENELLNFF